MVEKVKQSNQQEQENLRKEDESLNIGEYEFYESLQQGKYLGILETYVSDEKWSLERAVRDIWQNFADANGGSLDNVDLDVQREDGEIFINIYGSAEYDFRRLLHFGAGSKIGSKTTAGRYGEGTRIFALHLLRDYGFQRVKFKSENWELEFYLDKAPKYELPKGMEDLRGLYVKLNIVDEYYPGNQVQLITSNPDNVTAIQEAKDLFYHSENKDFFNPDIDTDKGGLKIHFGKNGNLYINGQRVHFNSRDEWYTLPDMTLWVKEIPTFEGVEIKLGRDRSLVTPWEIKSIILPFIVESADIEDCQLLLRVLEPIYDYDAKASYEAETLLFLLISRLKKEGVKMDFPKDYLAKDVKTDQADLLREFDYKLCRSEFGDIGMRKASEEWVDILEVHSVEMGNFEKARAELVQKAVEDFLKQVELHYNITAKPIRAFIGEHPFKTGCYDMGEVFLSLPTLRFGDLSKILTTYCHEICHCVGPDDSAEFSYALTDLKEAWNRFIINNPNFLQDLNKKFQAIQGNPNWESVGDFLLFVNPLLNKVKEKEFSILKPPRIEDLNEEIQYIKLSLSKIIDSQFLGEYSYKNLISIYKTIIENEDFKKVQKFLLNIGDLPTREDEKKFEKEKEVLLSEKYLIEQEIKEIEEQIKSSTKRTRVLKEKRENNSKLQKLKKRLKEIESQIDEVNEKLELCPTRLELLYFRLNKYRIFNGVYNLNILGSVDRFIIACFELILERNKHKPIEEFIKDIDELLIFLKNNVQDFNKIIDIVALALHRVKQDISNDANKFNLSYAQTLYNSIIGLFLIT